MNGPTFFLGVNFLVAVGFCVLFAVVSTRSRTPVAARYLAGGFGVASLSAISELLVAYSTITKLWALSAFGTVLAGMMLLNAGIAMLYGRGINWWLGILFASASVILAYTIYGLPRGTPLQAFGYQTPFALVLLSSATAIYKSHSDLTVDRFLLGLLLFTGLHFFAKAGLAVLVGSGTTAKDYIHTNYALISQSATAVLMVALGLTLLATIVLDMMAEQQTESEKDPLSGLANRRGFERSVETYLDDEQHAQHAFIICDLDYFKSINDTYGHPVGDRVIQAFGQQLREQVPRNAVVGRVGGEEFAVFVPGAEMAEALALAHMLRSATERLANLPDDLRVSASFGVSRLSQAEGLAEAFRQADIALYQAKRAGRNTVKEAGSPEGVSTAILRDRRATSLTATAMQDAATARMYAFRHFKKRRR